ncbi:Hsp20/alpha crystallin family protein [Pseudobacillus sp. FSL P4-0506]|uniref:Hsp20/alpha crystallin family protein n=1 Tax=unclassified Pseudobacillus TaxID=2619284 RepID=UPI0030F9C793
MTLDSEGTLLSISGTNNTSQEIKSEHLYTQERFTGRFQRSISLPARVSVKEDMKATYKNGILEICMPKLNDPSQDKKRIDVEFN